VEATSAGVLLATSAGVLLASQSDLASGGNAPGRPLPSGWWQAAQLSRKTFSPFGWSAANAPDAARSRGTVRASVVRFMDIAIAKGNSGLRTCSIVRMPGGAALT